jgi:hypothetical protein
VRIRSVKPDFWSDTVMASLRPEVRLTYIGLWCEADDAGWFVYDVPALAHDLYGYDPRSVRERRVTAHVEALAAIGRVVLHPCGHGEIPTLAVHQRFGGRPVYTVQRVHARDCAQVRADAPQGRGGKGREGKGGVWGGNGEARQEGGLADRVAAFGFDPKRLDR